MIELAFLLAMIFGSPVWGQSLVSEGQTTPPQPVPQVWEGKTSQGLFFSATTISSPFGPVLRNVSFAFDYPCETTGGTTQLGFWIGGLDILTSYPFQVVISDYYSRHWMIFFSGQFSSIRAQGALESVTPALYQISGTLSPGSDILGHTLKSEKCVTGILTWDAVPTPTKVSPEGSEDLASEEETELIQVTPDKEGVTIRIKGAVVQDNAVRLLD